ncbi:DUF3592 domain-containing protein [Ammonicoccus fulvus]|uniref:DUF3592 domain-containing protein n=1 Tax=Ammonicoccus fulvus TaxID=3138240 RepID=A0ABZ3FP86_9ACTN
MQLSEVRGPRRVIGLGAAALALAALLTALGFSVANLVFQFSTIEAVGEVVAVRPGQDEAGQARPDRHAVVIEYADRNGQVRRFDETVAGDAPRRGDELAVRYSARPPVQARIANYWWIWREATLAGAIALVLGLGAEEALRVRSRTAAPRP